MLKTALDGLAYVHRQNIVHCDVKPANIFIDERGCGVLGDFDVSRDTATRATMAFTAANIAGGTFDYMAPELMSTTATAASDVYSFALTMFDVHFRPSRDAAAGDGALVYQRAKFNEVSATQKAVAVPAYANEVVGKALRDLLASMLVVDASKRVTAGAAQAHRYFSLALGGVEGARDAAKDRRQCAIMMEDCWLDEGVECRRGHFMSNAALAGYVRAQSNEAAGKHRGNVKCPTSGVSWLFAPCGVD